MSIGNSVHQSLKTVVMLMALSSGVLLAAGCCDMGSNKASWAANDTGPATVDVSRKLPNGQQDWGRVRDRPNGNIITSLPSGTQVNVIANEYVRTGAIPGNWSKIQYPGGEGWMHQDILLKARERR